MEDLTAFEPYKLHVYDLSYFSGKMQAYLAYKEIPHRTHEISIRELAERIAPHTGLVEVPVVERADGVFLRDSTAMIEWFEARYPHAAVLPEDPAASFFCRLLEDYADEGLWRPALYYRWAFDKDALLNARRFTEDFLSVPLVPAALLRRRARKRQQVEYMKREGITAENRADVERHYNDELRDLEAVFRTRSFLFGERPSLADFGYFASMFRHFGIDPTPARIMRNTAPAVYEWVARMWNARASRLAGGAWASGEGGLPPGLEPLLARAARRFLPVLHANARAVADERVHFDATLEGKDYPGLAAVPFLAWRRRVLQEALAALPGLSAEHVRDVLGSTGCLAWLEEDGVLPDRYPGGELLPLSRPRTMGRIEKLQMQVFGTPHHREAGRLKSK
ncbi:MAG: glutathione S-transferase family protein [Candidatus Binatia bacterium]